MRSSQIQPLAGAGAAVAARRPRAVTRRTFVVPLAALLTLPLVAAAQGAGAVTGIVTDMDDRPLARAQVSVAGLSLISYSNDEGKFIVLGVAPGTQALTVKMLGYGPLTLPIEIVAGRTSELQVVMTAEPIELDEVAVSVDPSIFVPPHMKAFEERRARGNGTFFTNEDIRRIQPRVFTDILRRVPGMKIQTTGRVQSGRNDQLLRACPVMYYLNGAPLPLPLDASPNNFIAAEEVVAVEFYNSAQLPPQYNTSMYNVRCGLVVVWTRSGPEPPRRVGRSK